MLATARPSCFTLLGDESVAYDVLFVGDQDDDVVTFGRPQLLQTRLRVLERRTVRHRIDDHVGVDQVATLTRLHTHTHTAVSLSFTGPFSLPASSRGTGPVEFELYPAHSWLYAATRDVVKCRRQASDSHQSVIYLPEWKHKKSKQDTKVVLQH